MQEKLAILCEWVCVCVRVSWRPSWLAGRLSSRYLNEMIQSSNQLVCRRMSSPVARRRRRREKKSKMKIEKIRRENKRECKRDQLVVDLSLSLARDNHFAEIKQINEEVTLEMANFGLHEIWWLYQYLVSDQKERKRDRDGAGRASRVETRRWFLFISLYDKSSFVEPGLQKKMTLARWKSLDLLLLLSTR